MPAKKGTKKSPAKTAAKKPAAKKTNPGPKLTAIKKPLTTKTAVFEELAQSTGLTSRELLTILGFAAIGWAACAATMGIGMALTRMELTLILHAIGAPVYFIVISWIYFRRFSYTGPLTTAALFIGFVAVVDFFLVALVINRSLDMFRSFLGTWLPFMLIFASTWVTGKALGK